MGAKITQALFYGQAKIGGIIAVWRLVPIYQGKSHSFAYQVIGLDTHLPTCIVKQPRLEVYKPKGHWPM